MLIADQRTAALDLPMGLVYLAVPICGVFFILYALREIVEPDAAEAPAEETSED